MQYPGYILSNSLPSKEGVNHFTEDLIHYLFPVTHYPEEFLRSHERIQYHLRGQLRALLTSVDQATVLDYDHLVEEYFENLSALKDCLLKDAKLILDFDPAATSFEEIILSYPGFQAITVHRLANPLYLKKVPVIPRMMSEWAHSKTGIDIHPGAKIGCPFFIDHGTGVVIGETSIIGNNVKIYQGVTLGALAVRKKDAEIKRHPTVEDNVIIYAGSTILGGKTTIGHDSIIGGNTWLTQTVPAFSVVYQRHETVINSRKDFQEPINFII